MSALAKLNLYLLQSLRFEEGRIFLEDAYNNLMKHYGMCHTFTIQVSGRLAQLYLSSKIKKYKVAKEITEMAMKQVASCMGKIRTRV
jgi:hypothetical protein